MDPRPAVLLSERFRLPLPVVAGGAPSIFLLTGTASPFLLLALALEGPCAATIEGSCAGGELERSVPLLPESWPELQSAMAEKPATAMAYSVREEPYIFVLCKMTKLSLIKIKHP